jgi:hypothetical protein
MWGENSSTVLDKFCGDPYANRMSRTFKHIAARAFHKRLRATSGYAARRAAYGAATPGAIGTTRYGVKRHYEAGMKVKNRRSKKFKAKEQMRVEIDVEILASPENC